MRFDALKLYVPLCVGAMLVACTTSPTERPPPAPGAMAKPKIDVTVSGIRATAEKNLATAIMAVASTEDLGADMEMLEDLDLRFSRKCGGDEPVRPAPEPGDNGGMGSMGGSGNSGGDGTAPTPEPCVEKPAEERAIEMAKEIVDEIFEAENLEADETKRVVYRIKVECPTPPQEDEPYAPGAPNTDPPPAPDSEPAPNCEPVDVRLAFTSVREGDLDVEILVGPNQIKLATVQLHEKLASIAIDLSDALAVVNEVQRISGTSEDFAAPDSMSGAILAKVENTAAGQYTASFSVTRAIELVSTSTQGAFRIMIAAANPAMSLALNQSTRSITSIINWGSIGIEGDLSQIATEDAESGPVAVHLGGFTAELTATENGSSDSFEIKDISLGNESTHASFKGQRVVTIDLNEGHGRKFTLSVNDHADGISLGLAPAFDVKVLLNLTSLFTDPEDQPPAWLLNEEYRVSLDGASLPSVLAYLGGADKGEPVMPPGMGGGSGGTGGGGDGGDGDGGDGGGAPGPSQMPEPERMLKVIDGLLSLKTKIADKNITVNAGSCLLMERDAPEFTGPGQPSGGGSGSTGGSTGGDPVPPNGGNGDGMNPDEEPEHPFDRFSSGACE